MSRTFRVLAASVATLMLLPCLGFGLFGLAASQEPGVGIGATIVYIVLDILLLGVFVVIWRSALRADRNLPWECPACGYDRRESTGGPCAECGHVAA